MPWTQDFRLSGHLAHQISPPLCEVSPGEGSRMDKSTYPIVGQVNLFIHRKGGVQKHREGFSERRTFFLDLGLTGAIITSQEQGQGRTVFRDGGRGRRHHDMRAAAVGRRLFVGGGHPGHKISGWADTPLRTRFRADGRKSFLPSTCSYFVFVT